jgi:GT2 family glycosyltransferase
VIRRPDVSVVVPVRGRSEELQRCLTSVRSQELAGLRTEVVVVDDASEDAQPAMVAKRLGARVVNLPKHSGSAFARNAGIEAATGGLLWFLDSDAELPGPDVLSRIVSVARSHSFGQVGGGLIPSAVVGRAHVAGWTIDLRTGSSSCTYRRVDEFEPGGLEMCTYLPTFNCLMDREVVDRVGWFDDQHAHLGEDKDYGQRVARLGMQSAFGPTVAAIHHWSPAERHLDGLTKTHRTQLRFIWRQRGAASLLPAAVTQQWRYVSEAVHHRQARSGDSLTVAGNRYVDEVLGLRQDAPVRSAVRKSFDLWSALAWTIAQGPPATDTWFERSLREHV